MHIVSDCFFSKTEDEHNITITFIIHRVAVKADTNNNKNNSKKIGEENRK